MGSSFFSIDLLLIQRQNIMSRKLIQHIARHTTLCTPRQHEVKAKLSFGIAMLSRQSWTLAISLLLAIIGFSSASAGPNLSPPTLIEGAIGAEKSFRANNPLTADDVRVIIAGVTQAAAMNKFIRSW